MTKLTKKTKAARSKLVVAKQYPVLEALKLIKEIAFCESVKA